MDCLLKTGLDARVGRVWDGMQHTFYDLWSGTGVGEMLKFRDGLVQLCGVVEAYRKGD